MPRQINEPMAIAMQWVARILAAAAMMMLPGIGGQWLDRKFGTRFIALVGFALGLTGAMVYLISVTREIGRTGRGDPKDGDTSTRDP